MDPVPHSPTQMEVQPGAILWCFWRLPVSPYQYAILPLSSDSHSAYVYSAGPLQAHFPGFIFFFNFVCTSLSICLLPLSLSFFIWEPLYRGKWDVYVKSVLYWKSNNASKRNFSVYFKVKYISIQAASLPNRTSGKSNWLDKLLLDGCGLISKDKCFVVNCLDHMPTGDCI